MAALTPGGLARATYRAILAEYNPNADEDDPEIAIGSEDYRIQVMESNYDESNQIAGKEGDIILHDLVTYGYGETIKWHELCKRVAELEKWCKAIMEPHKCSYEIRVSANYW